VDVDPLGVVTLAELSADVTSPRNPMRKMVREVAQYVAPFAAEHGSDLRDMHMLGTSGTVTNARRRPSQSGARYDRRRIDALDERFDVTR